MNDNLDQDRVLYRIAKMSDAAELAKAHLICGENQVGSFMEKLGKQFLTRYYKTVLACKYSIIVVGYSQVSGKIYGFHSGSIDTHQQRKYLRKNRFLLAMSAALCLAKRPRLIPEIYKRYKSLEDDSNTSVVRSGARGEYWAWKPGAPSYGGAQVHKNWHNTMLALGCLKVRSEVNVSQPRVRKAIIAMGGVILNSTHDFNGNERLIVEYDLVKYCKRFPL